MSLIPLTSFRQAFTFVLQTTPQQLTQVVADNGIDSSSILLGGSNGQDALRDVVNVSSTETTVVLPVGDDGSKTYYSNAFKYRVQSNKFMRIVKHPKQEIAFENTSSTAYVRFLVYTTAEDGSIHHHVVNLHPRQTIRE